MNSLSRRHEQSSPSQVAETYGRDVITKIKWWQTCPRNIAGICPFMKFAIDNCVEVATGGQHNSTGMVTIQGNSVTMLEAWEEVQTVAMSPEKSAACIPSPCFTMRKIDSCTFSYRTFLLNKLS